MPRPAHHIASRSLLNTPTPPFEGASNSLYGPRVPQRAHNTARKGPPQSIADHIDDAIKRVAGLTPRQRLALHNELTKMARDISFIRMVHESREARGPRPPCARMRERPFEAAAVPIFSARSVR
jgi:hypothetical protein